MELFQKSVLNKYLREIDDKRISDLYSVYSTYFLNLEIQQNIRDSKEEQFQEGFLRELFVNVLGYTINPNPNYNLTTELKNETGAKKADGAIIVGGKALGVIELKSTTTKDLESIRQQAFDYKANQSECVYVVTSNFEKLRFYIDNAVDYEEFDLFTLSLEQFKLLYLCLHVDSIMAGIPKTAKTASLVKEENVTKKLYADYSVFKEKLFNSIIINEDNIALANGTDDKKAKLILFKKTQKLMDRFLFIFFAEDRGLIPPNTTSTILAEWEQLKSLDAYRPLYDRFKRHFDYINTGWKGDNYEVFAYNGGLFLPDEILDNITISDDVLFEQTTILTIYDFDSEVDVNILGHIFEHSLNEIESMNAELEGQEIDLKKTKRKKDGVFYTPKYITKYIVDNTIGKLCEEKKEELSIVEDEYLRGKKGRRKDTVKQLESKLIDYRNWLLQITVVDPACGSGAFLNQALEFLIREHRWIDEMTTKLFGGGLVFQDVENSILENNLYGVDINEESIEIAKLSLWLRTAQKGRKLTSLNNNIKCGNSLIDDPEVAGDKAFKWEEEFPKVFAKGGFDVVIGNPPYVSHDRVDNKSYLKMNFTTYQAFADLFCFFYELGIIVLKKDGILSFITSNSFLRAEYGKSLRRLFINESTILEVIDIGEAQIFSDATVNSVIVTLSKSKIRNRKAMIVNKNYNTSTDFWTYIEEFKFYYDQNDFDSLSWNLIEPDVLRLRNKIAKNNKTLEELGTKIRLGIATGSNEAFIINEEQKDILIKKDYRNSEIIKPILRGRDIHRYYFEYPNLYVLLTRNGIDVVNDYPTIYEHLDSFGDSFKNRGAKGQHWTNLRACSFFKDFKEKKIIWIELTDSGRFSLCVDEVYLLNSAYFLLPPKEFVKGYLLALLNSSLMKFYLKQIANTSGMGTTRWINIYVKEFPIKIASKETQLKIDTQSKKITDYLNQFRGLLNTFISLLQTDFDVEKPSTKLQNWYKLDFKQFVTELKKKKVELTLTEKAEWMSYFNEKKAEAQELKSKIDATDNEIDLMVYKLYDLTEDEIKIVEEEL